jgi:hypothetical protein
VREAYFRMLPLVYISFIAAIEPTSGDSPTPANTPANMPGPWQYARECEMPDEATVERTIRRSNASGLLVHGQFGTLDVTGCPPQSDDVKNGLPSSVQTDYIWLQLRYSKASLAGTATLVYFDDEPTPRASIYPDRQVNWDTFAWLGPVDLGAVGAGEHVLRFYTEGQQWSCRSRPLRTYPGVGAVAVFEEQTCLCASC